MRFAQDWDAELIEQLAQAPARPGPLVSPFTLRSVPLCSDASL